MGAKEINDSKLSKAQAWGPLLTGRQATSVNFVYKVKPPAAPVESFLAKQQLFKISSHDIAKTFSPDIGGSMETGTVTYKSERPWSFSFISEASAPIPGLLTKLRRT